MADAHVIGNEIKDQAKIVLLERVGEARESFIAAQVGIEPLVIDDVVAMRAAGPRFQERRGVEMGDAEPLEIGRKRGRIVEAEILGQLDPISRNGNGRRHQPSPIAA